jgi:hypothetical protein
VNWDELSEELGPIDVLPPLNAAVYLAAFSYLGASFWKAACVSAFVFVATKYHYGRRTLIKGGIVAAIVLSPFWLGLVPPPTEMVAAARSVGTVLLSSAQTPE